MRAARRCCVLGVLALALGTVRGTEAAPEQTLRVTPAHTRLQPGESIQLRAVPPGEATWFTTGPGAVDRDGRYRAPYVVSLPGARVLVSAARGPRDAAVVAEAFIELSAGTFPGASDCLGSGQSWSDDGRGPGYVALDELPEPITRVPAEYSKSMRARGLAGGLIVNALVCRSGRVIDAAASWGRDRTPIPELEESAIEAAKQWVFKPGLVAGQPMATVVAIPFQFPPP